MTPAWLPWQLLGPPETRQPVLSPDLGNSLLLKDSMTSKKKHWRRNIRPLQSSPVAVAVKSNATESDKE